MKIIEALDKIKKASSKRRNANHFKINKETKMKMKLK